MIRTSWRAVLVRDSRMRSSRTGCHCQNRAAGVVQDMLSDAADQGSPDLVQCSEAPRAAVALSSHRDKSRVQLDGLVNDCLAGRSAHRDSFNQTPFDVVAAA